MKKERYLRGIRLLAECYQAFEQLSSLHIRTTGLTPSQFDIVATLGNTPGMSLGELGQKTLITKGTLTGVIDRLEAKGLVKRSTDPQDRRSTLVELTERGAAEFDRIFLPHVEFCKAPFQECGDIDFDALEGELTKLKARLQEGLARRRGTAA